MPSKLQSLRTALTSACGKNEIGNVNDLLLQLLELDNYGDDAIINSLSAQVHALMKQYQSELTLVDNGNKILKKMKQTLTQQRAASASKSKTNSNKVNAVESTVKSNSSNALAVDASTRQKMRNHLLVGLKKVKEVNEEVASSVAEGLEQAVFEGISDKSTYVDKCKMLEYSLKENAELMLSLHSGNESYPALLRKSVAELASKDVRKARLKHADIKTFPEADLVQKLIDNRVLSSLSSSSSSSSSSPSISRRDIIPDKEVFVLSNVFNFEECNVLIKETRKIGYKTEGYSKDYRGNKRLVVQDTRMASFLWDRIRAFCPSEIFESGFRWIVTGLNDVIRYSEYMDGDRFAPHVDKFETINDEEGFLKSMFTVNCYLNSASEFGGGSTRFYSEKPYKTNHAEIEYKFQECSIEPEFGKVLVFRQPPTGEYYHDGELVTSGYKYLLRSDVMYRRVN